MVKLEFYEPSGVMDAARPHAPRVDALANKRIGLVSNDHWQVERMLPMLKTWLEEDFPGAQVLPFETFPHGSVAIDSEETAALIKQSGVDAVIVGNAA